MIAESPPVVLLDWGETLVWIPGMLHDVDRHLACVAAIFDPHIRPLLHAAGVEPDCSTEIGCYVCLPYPDRDLTANPQGASLRRSLRAQLRLRAGRITTIGHTL